MRSTNFILSVLILISILQLSCRSQKIIRSEVNDISQIEQHIEKVIGKNIPPSISVIVVNKDSIVYEKSFGYADRPKGLKATSNTAYQWWSITKLFTATAILQLQEKALLNINDPVNDYLPYFKVRGSEKEITIKQLLTHSSGLRDIGMKILGWIHYEGDSAYDQTELVKTQLPKHDKLKAEPGTKGIYSNLGYMVLAAIIEKVAQQSYASYIHENILDPLEMNDTGFDYRYIQAENIAAGSHPRDFMSMVAFSMISRKKAIREKKDGIFWFNPLFSNQQGSTGLIGSVHDLSRFMISMLHKDGSSVAKILSTQSLTLMQSPHVSVDKSPARGVDNLQFGLSWFLHRDDNHNFGCSHGGAGAAFVAHLRIYPKEEFGIAVLANSTYLGKDQGYTLVNSIANSYFKRRSF